MTTELDDRILSAVHALGTCTPAQVRDHSCPECTVSKVSRLLHSLERYRFVTVKWDGPRSYYAPYGQEPVVAPPAKAPRGPYRALRPRLTGDMILDALREHGPSTVRELSESVGFSDTWLRAHLYEMESKGKAVCIRMGPHGHRHVWCVPTGTLPAPYQSGREEGGP